MKFLILLALAISTASAYNWYGYQYQPMNVGTPFRVQQTHIINGDDAEPEQFPYQVGLYLSKSFLKKFWCGGSLISNEWVLTAAHCTDGIKKVEIYLGAISRKSSEVKFTVNNSNIIIHPEWNPDKLRNDISLIQIPAVNLSATIQPIKLPTKSNLYSSYAGENGIAIGWGRTSDDKKSLIDTLQYAEMPIISNRICRKTFGALITSSSLCAATNLGTSTCKGDSGGPLILSSTEVQIGLTSFGASDGCTKGMPVVFTRVTSYLDWIEENTNISN